MESGHNYSSKLDLPKLPTGTNSSENNIISKSQFTRKNLRQILHSITRQLKKTGVKTPHIFLPYRSRVRDERLDAFLKTIFPNGQLVDTSDEKSIVALLELFDEFTLMSALKYLWSRLPNNEIIGWDVYLEFKHKEEEEGYPKNAFLSIMPKCLSSPAHASIVYDFLDLLISLASNSQYNLLSGRKIAKMASLWAFNGSRKLQSLFYDATEKKETGFIEGLESWKSSSDALFHLVLSFLRAMLPEKESETLKLPKPLQSLLITTSYPPEKNTDSRKSMITIPCVVVKSTKVSSNAFELLSKVRHTLSFDKKDSYLSIENYTILKNIFLKGSTNEIVNTLSEESRRILDRLTDDTISSDYGVYPGWVKGKNHDVDPNIPLFSTINIIDVTLQDYYIWTWLSTLASDQTPHMKGLFGRSLVLEACLKGFQKWLIVTEQVMGTDEYLKLMIPEKSVPMNGSVNFPLANRGISDNQNSINSKGSNKDVPVKPLVPPEIFKNKEVPSLPPAPPAKEGPELLPKFDFDDSDHKLGVEIEDSHYIYPKEINYDELSEYKAYVNNYDYSSELITKKLSNTTLKDKLKLARRPRPPTLEEPIIHNYNNSSEASFNLKNNSDQSFSQPRRPSASPNNSFLSNDEQQYLNAYQKYAESKELEEKKNEPLPNIPHSLEHNINALYLNGNTMNEKSYSYNNTSGFIQNAPERQDHPVSTEDLPLVPPSHVESNNQQMIYTNNHYDNDQRIGTSNKKATYMNSTDNNGPKIKSDGKASTKPQPHNGHSGRPKIKKKIPKHLLPAIPNDTSNMVINNKGSNEELNKHSRIKPLNGFNNHEVKSNTVIENGPSMGRPQNLGMEMPSESPQGSASHLALDPQGQNIHSRHRVSPDGNLQTGKINEAPYHNHNHFQESYETQGHYQEMQPQDSFQMQETFQFQGDSQPSLEDQTMYSPHHTQAEAEYFDQDNFQHDEQYHDVENQHFDGPKHGLEYSSQEDFLNQDINQLQISHQDSFNHSPPTNQPLLMEKQRRPMRPAMIQDRSNIPMQQSAGRKILHHQPLQQQPIPHLHPDDRGHVGHLKPSHLPRPAQVYLPQHSQAYLQQPGRIILPQPPHVYLPQPPQAYLPQPPQGFMSQSPQAFLPQLNHHYNAPQAASPGMMPPMSYYNPGMNPPEQIHGHPYIQQQVPAQYYQPQPFMPAQASPYVMPAPVALRAKNTTSDMAMRAMPKSERFNKNNKPNKASLRAALNDGAFGI